jgi:hypothetical protein
LLTSQTAFTIQFNNLAFTTPHFMTHVKARSYAFATAKHSTPLPHLCLLSLLQVAV